MLFKKNLYARNHSLNTFYVKLLLLNIILMKFTHFPCSNSSFILTALCYFILWTRHNLSIWQLKGNLIVSNLGLFSIIFFIHLLCVYVCVCEIMCAFLVYIQEWNEWVIKCTFWALVDADKQFSKRKCQPIYILKTFFSLNCKWPWYSLDTYSLLCVCIANTFSH